jgi:anti-anti-sigma regulatory factor
MTDVLSPKGKLDLTAAADLHAAFMAQPDGDVVLDLGGVALMGALCLQVCISAARTLGAQGHAVRVINTPDHVAAQMAAMGMTPDTLGGHAA